MTEKILKTRKTGMLAMLSFIVLYLLAIALVIFGAVEAPPLMVLGILWLSIGWIPFLGLKVLKPQEALVLTLFGKYVGTLKGDGFYLSNARQKVNDALGNPVVVGIAVVWTVKDTAKAVFNVDNYKEYLSLQCDAAVRDIVKIYPYDIAPEIDTTGDGQADDGSLRGSTVLVAERIRALIQEKVEEAGLEIVEARITYLAYAPEIAAVMLQRQQATAIVDARKTIVDGAVGMVEMALDQLSEKKVVELDEERKAAMVSNLLVVLCGNNDTQPIVNTGSLY